MSSIPEQSSKQLLIEKSEQILKTAKAALQPQSPTILEVKPDKITLLEENYLSERKLLQLTKHLDTLQYVPHTNTKSSETFLYGDTPYVYNKTSKKVPPVPINTSPIVAEVLKTVNSSLGTDFNSVLLNKYRNKNISLDWHKDDEPEVDNSRPIATLSIGAVRRMMFSTDKNKLIHTDSLKPNSLLVMRPGIQDLYYHKIATGRSSHRSECGLRYSVTFRKINDVAAQPSPGIVDNSPSQNQHQPPVLKSTPVKSQSVAAVVFGSSLTKGLKQDLLSRDGKNFRVYSHGGARVRTIINDVRRVKESSDFDLDSVSQVFLVCGGNDVENIYPAADLYKLLESYEELISVTSTAFPNAKINLCSLIPRRTVYEDHRERMLWVNEQLSVFCSNIKIRFVDIFSHFLNHKSRDLSYNLFQIDELHFSKAGASVMGKVFIAIVHNPWY